MKKFSKNLCGGLFLGLLFSLSFLLLPTTAQAAEKLIDLMAGDGANSKIVAAGKQFKQYFLAPGSSITKIETTHWEGFTAAYTTHLFLYCDHDTYTEVEADTTCQIAPGDYYDVCEFTFADYETVEGESCYFSLSKEAENFQAYFVGEYFDYAPKIDYWWIGVGLQTNVQWRSNFAVWGETTPPVPSDIVFSKAPPLYYTAPINTTFKIPFSYDESIFSDPDADAQISFCDTFPTAPAYECGGLTAIGNQYVWSPIDITLGASTGKGFFTVSATTTGPVYYEVLPYPVGETSFEPLYFAVNFVDTSETVDEIIAGIGTLGGTTTSTAVAIFGLDPEELACTTEEWESDSWVTGAKCSLVKTFYTVVAQIANFITRAVTWSVERLGDAFSNLFPFNIPIKIYQSWTTAAAATAMPDGAEWLEEPMDIDGNVEITTLNLYGATTTWSIWGPDVMAPEGGGQANFWAHVRSIMTLLLWAGFLLKIIQIGTDIFNEIRFQARANRVQKENWQL